MFSPGFNDSYKLWLIMCFLMSQQEPDSWSENSQDNDVNNNNNDNNKGNNMCVFFTITSDASYCD